MKDSDTQPVETIESGEPVKVLDWLETEVTAISCRYHGDPSYDHDAYWMRDRVVKLLADARKVFASPQPSQPAEAGENLPCPICKGIEGCDHTVPERVRASAVVLDDEPLFAFDRKELIAMVRELLTTAQPATGGK